MTTQEDRARRFTAHMAAMVGTGRAPLLTVNDVGERFFVTALGEEPASALFTRVSRSGGYATAYILMEDSVATVAFDREPADAHHAPLHLSELPPHTTDSAAEFVNFLEQHPEGVSANISGPHRLPAIARSEQALPL